MLGLISRQQKASYMLCHFVVVREYGGGAKRRRDEQNYRSTYYCLTWRHAVKNTSGCMHADNQKTSFCRSTGGQTQRGQLVQI